MTARQHQPAVRQHNLQGLFDCCAGVLQDFTAVLQAQQANPCAALNELAANVLDALRSIVPALLLRSQHDESAQGLQQHVSDVLEDDDTPLALKTKAAAAMGGLAKAKDAPAFFTAAAGESNLSHTTCFSIDSDIELLEAAQLLGC